MDRCCFFSWTIWPAAMLFIGFTVFFLMDKSWYLLANVCVKLIQNRAECLRLYAPPLCLFELRSQLIKNSPHLVV